MVKIPPNITSCDTVIVIKWKVIKGVKKIHVFSIFNASNSVRLINYFWQIGEKDEG